MYMYYASLFSYLYIYNDNNHHPHHQTDHSHETSIIHHIYHNSSFLYLIKWLINHLCTSLLRILYI